MKVNEHRSSSEQIREDNITLYTPHTQENLVRPSLDPLDNQAFANFDWKGLSYSMMVAQRHPELCPHLAQSEHPLLGPDNTALHHDKVVGHFSVVDKSTLSTRKRQISSASSSGQDCILKKCSQEA